MPEDEYDELQFKMVNGETLVMELDAGQGKQQIGDLPESGWITLDDETRIRAESVISVRLVERADQAPGVY
jgi:hypothetical protein